MENAQIGRAIHGVYELPSETLSAKITKLMKQINARRVIIKNAAGNAVFTVPLTLGVIGALISPMLASFGTLTALFAKCTIIIDKK